MQVMGAARDALSMGEAKNEALSPFYRARLHVLLLHTLSQPGWVAATQCNLLCSE